MTDTHVAYHSDYLRSARPAVNVKVRMLHADRDYAALYDRIAGNPTLDADALAEAAWEYVCRRFWDDAAIEADRLGLGAIEQEGRSGGWLVLTDGRDPLDMVGNERRSWLARYRRLVEWCDRQTAAAGIETARVLRAYAADMAVAP